MIRPRRQGGTSMMKALGLWFGRRLGPRGAECAAVILGGVLFFGCLIGLLTVVYVVGYLGNEYEPGLRELARGMAGLLIGGLASMPGWMWAAMAVMALIGVILDRLKDIAHDVHRIAEELEAARMRRGD